MDPTFRNLPAPAVLVSLLEMYPENFTIFLRTEDSANCEKKVYSIVSNNDLKEENTKPGQDTRHGKFVVSSRNLRARDFFPFEGSPIEPVGGFLIPRDPDAIDLEAQSADEGWVNVSKRKKGGLVRGVVCAERRHRGVGSEGLVALLVWSYVLLAVAILVLSYILHKTLYLRSG